MGKYWLFILTNPQKQMKYSDACLNQTLNKLESCINQTPVYFEDSAGPKVIRLKQVLGYNYI